MLPDATTTLRALIVAVTSAIVAGCVTAPTAPLSQRCATEVFTLDAAFDGGGMAGCRAQSDGSVEVVLRPEDRPINPSPWYAVRLTATQPATATVTLVYEEHPHRYLPKLSRGSGPWQYVPESAVTASDDGMRVRIDVPLAGEPVFLTAQELVTASDYDTWLGSHAMLPGIERSLIGRSIEDRPIEMLATTADQALGTVVLVGRQHPPELTGTIAMLPFADEVLGPSELAQQFRARFNTAIVPFMNPDGVYHGYWRHNLGSTDLNRDWGPFAQPETQAVLRVLDRLAQRPDTRPVVFLDFHSTRRNVFYTQYVGEDGTDYGFTAKWLAQSRARLSDDVVDYEFERAERPQSELPTSKNYVHGRFAIPAITYEVGDETERGATVNAARVLAQEMMRILLVEHAGVAAP